MSEAKQAAPQPGADSAGLGNINPKPFPLVIRGEDLQLREVPLRNLGAFTQACAPLMRDLVAGLEDPQLLYEQHGAELTAMLAIGADRPESWAADLGETEFLALLVGILRVNKSFFSRLMKSRLRQAAEAGIGQMPSIPSSGTAT